jgi:hypothetical protein
MYQKWKVMKQIVGNQMKMVVVVVEQKMIVAQVMFFAVLEQVKQVMIVLV